MCAVPGLAPVAFPLASTCATLAASLVHVTVLVMSAVLVSAYVPVAVYCCTCPTFSIAFAGVTVIDTRDAGVTTIPVCVPVMLVVMVSVVVRLHVPAAPKVAVKVCTPASPERKE
jgi:hypothetical protein